MANRVVTYLRKEKYFLFEAYLMIRLTGIGLYIFTVKLLIQDKVCFNFHHRSPEFCQQINQQDHDYFDGLAKDRILAQSAEFNNYRNFIQAIPMFLWSLFVGSFLDKYRGATRLLFLLSNIIDHVDLIFFMVNAYFFDMSPYYLLVAAGLTIFTGGMISFFTASNRYIILNSSEKQRPIRFVLFHFLIFVAYAIGTYIGGHLLRVIEADDQGPQLRTYNTNFALASFFIIMSTAILFVLKWEPIEDKDVEGEVEGSNHSKPVEIEISQLDTSHSTNYSDSSMNLGESHDETTDNSRNITNQTIKTVNNNNNKEEGYPKTGEEGNNKQGLLRVLLDFKNIRDTYSCVLRARPKHERKQIFLLTSIILIFYFVSFGIDAILLQFTEKSYHWDTMHFSTVTAVGNVTLNIIMLLLSWLLLKKLRISDYNLMIGCLPFGIASHMLLGMILDPRIYLISIPINAITGLSSIVAKSILSRIISKDEIGKIFSLISTMEAIVPFFGSLAFTKIFAATVSTQPGMIFITCAMCYFIALIIAITVKYFSTRN